MIRLAKELARMRQEERERSQKELAKLQVEYLAKEGRYVLDGERATLREIRQQLDAVLQVCGGLRVLDVSVSETGVVGWRGGGRGAMRGVLPVRLP